MSSEHGSDVDAGLVSTSQSQLPGSMGEAESRAPEIGQVAESGTQGEGRRTQLRIVRENIQSLSTDVRRFRKSHEASTKSLERQLASVRKELAARSRANEHVGLSKSYQASAKRMERQMATLRRELSALKSGIARDAAKGRAKQEATLAKILRKVSIKPSKPSKRPRKARR